MAGRKKKYWAENERVKAYIEDFSLNCYIVSLDQLSCIEVAITRLYEQLSSERDTKLIVDLLTAIEEATTIRNTLLSSMNSIRKADLDEINRKLWQGMPMKRQAYIKSHAQTVARKLYPKVQPCSIPNCDKVGERHHPDYLQPDMIVWLCHKHHSEAEKDAEGVWQKAILPKLPEER